MEANHQRPPQHFLVVTYPAQGHINPARNLANHLARTSNGSRVTFSTSVSAHRKMFPDDHRQEQGDGLVTYIPFSDGYDDGFSSQDNPNTFLSSFKHVGSCSLSSLIDDLSSRGRPVTCIIYTFFVSWAADVARDHRLRFVQYWIQPASVFAMYYHFFHGYDAIIGNQNGDPSSTVQLPGLRPLQLRDLPSFLTTTSEDNIYSLILSLVKEAFLGLDRVQVERKPKVLVNTFAELEPDAFASVNSNVDLIAVGPFLQDSSTSSDLFKQDNEKRYMEWLDAKAEKSVVYVSFGSLLVVKKRLMEAILKGLKASRRPYLWVVRKDNRCDEIELEDEEKLGMVVEWCSQVSVLSHSSVGCFVTHCGWNSTIESLVHGVPTVGVPQWTDQGTNAMMLESVWGSGVRGEVDREGVIEGDELVRCLDLVMGDGERGSEIRRRAHMWKNKARVAVSEGGSSYRNLRTFLDDLLADAYDV